MHFMKDALEVFKWHLIYDVYMCHMHLRFREIHRLYRQNTASMNGVVIAHQMSPANQENGVKLMTKYVIVFVKNRVLFTK